MKKQILKEVYDFIMEHNNKVHTRDMQQFIRELAQKHDVSTTTIYRYIQEADWIHRTGYPISEAYYFIMHGELMKPFRDCSASPLRYIEAIQNESNRKALIDTVDIMLMYGIEECSSNFSKMRKIVAELLNVFGYQRIPEDTDRQLFKYTLITYKFLTEYVNAIEYFVEDFYIEPIDIEYELEIL